MKITQPIRLTAHHRAILRTARLRAGLTQQQVADEVGVSRPMIAMIELGQKPAPVELLGALANALSLSFRAKMTVLLGLKKPKK